MSESLPKLEIEPEWCSNAVLSSISAAAEPITVLKSSPEPTVEPIAMQSPDAESVSNSNPVPTKSARSALKLRTEAKTPRSKKSPSSTRVMKLVEAMRSRRVRIIVIAVSVLFVCGLIVLNWKSRSSNTSDEVADMDLSEFNESPGFEELRIGKTSEPQPLGVIAEAESIPTTDRFSTMESESRLPPLGGVTHADHTASRGRTAGGLVPASASSSGSRGAMLTGQIEFDTPQRSAEVPARPFRSLEMR